MVDLTGLKFSARHLLSIQDLSIEDVHSILFVSHWISKQTPSTWLTLNRKFILGSLFFQNSTRTRLSFESAAHRMGGSVIGFPDVSSTRAGDYFQESLTDTIRVVAHYVDCLVIRYTEKIPSHVVDDINVPIINAGDGKNEHPTQALLDYWMILRLLGCIKGKTIGLAGDLNCRDFRSLIMILTKFNVENLAILLPPSVVLPVEHQTIFNNHKIHFSILKNFDALLHEADIICMLPFSLPSFSEGSPQLISNRDGNLKNKKDFILNYEKLDRLGPQCPPILHVGPRTYELSSDTDQSPKSFYYEQAKYGVFLRAALIYLLLKKWENNS